MRVVFITVYCPPSYSGAGRIALNQAKFLRGKGTEAIILTVMSGPGMPNPETIEGVPIQRFRCGSNRPLDRLAFYFRCALWLFRNRRNFDLIHFSYMPYYWYPVFLAARILKKPIFLTMTLYGSDDLEAISRNRLAPLHLFFLRHVQGILAISKRLGEVSQKHVADEKLITYLTYPLDTSTFRPARSPDERHALRDQFGVPLNSLVVIFSGSVLHRKGIDLLVEAWPKVVERLPNAILYIAGPRTLGGEYGFTNQEFSCQLDVRIEELGVKDSIVFLGDRAKQIPELLRMADVFILPSREEGLPQALIEAMATGLPCIICDQPWVPKDLIRHEETGLVCQSMPEAIADSIISVLTNRCLAQHMGAAARAFAEQNHGPVTLTERLKKLYASSLH